MYAKISKIRFYDVRMSKISSAKRKSEIKADEHLRILIFGMTETPLILYTSTIEFMFSVKRNFEKNLFKSLTLIMMLYLKRNREIEAIKIEWKNRNKGKI